MSGARHWEQDKEATVYIGNIDERVTDSLIWELMLQAGRIVNVHLPKDRVTQTHQGYGFVEFISEEDAEYAARIMNQVRLYGKPIRVNKASADKQKPLEVGAELFIGNLDPMVDEKTLYDTFSRFGTLQSPPKIARDESALSKGYGFVSYQSFEASDDAIANMNGQYLMNKDISVQYAYKKDGKGERHGDEAERMLASQGKKHNVVPELQQMPAQLLLNGNVPAAPAAMMDGGMGMGMPMAPSPGFGGPPPGQMPPGFGGRPGSYNSVPPPQQQRANAPLPPPPSGLPQRPPPSQAGYGGPQDFHPQGFAPPPGFPQAMPPGFGGPPPGQMPPGFMPPGFVPQQQAPPGYARR
ncbi:probable spliceosome-associated protein SAP-49 [Phialocephala subalpina]|uniref:Probable spliceosome-associated protein SAP-49 n=1 Tax=Phialocephala subalpina TaxID=576137 RepID=A0A1L7X1S6_9HELO|nr:probable spliceosome-associated protein SAP-49 [Phialocephala subalpina]